MYERLPDENTEVSHVLEDHSGVPTAPIPEPPPVITTILPLALRSGLSGCRFSGTVRWIFLVNWKGRVYVKAGSERSKDILSSRDLRVVEGVVGLKMRLKDGTQYWVIFHGPGNLHLCTNTHQTY
jgi:hypothetical protein